MLYEFICPKGHKFDEMHPASDIPNDSVCPACLLPSRRNPIPSKIHIGSGKRSRTYQVWTGDPDKMPADMKDALNKQDRGEDWYRPPELLYGEKDAAHRDKIIKAGIERRKEKGVKYIPKAEPRPQDR